MNSHDLEKWDKEYVWHPFTQMKTYRESKPLIIERGEGSYLFDVEGNRYLDGYASLWVNVHGHNEPELNSFNDMINFPIGWTTARSNDTIRASFATN